MKAKERAIDFATWLTQNCTALDSDTVYINSENEIEYTMEEIYNEYLLRSK